MSSRSLALAVLALVGLLAPVAAPEPALAAETSLASADGTLELRGHGWGHGRGMSQYGAYGAALAGRSWAQILDFYYPGTQRSSSGTGSIRVLLTADNDGEMRVDDSGSITLVNGSGSVALPPGRIYRVVRSGTQQELQYWTGAVYRRYEHPLAMGLSLELRRTDGLLRLILPGGRQLELRGSLRAVSDGGSLKTVAVMGMEDYLRGVVPAEMPASWPLEALTAQAVAARSYAARLRATAGSRGWDACDTTSCQVFRGTATYDAASLKISDGEHPRANEAIARSSGVVLTHTSAGRTSIVLTEFSSSNGGWTAAGSLPYQTAKPDPYDGMVASSVHSWTARLRTADIERAWPAIGTFQRLVVDRRTTHGDWGGRIVSATLMGSRGTVSVTGDVLRSRLGLRSTWWTATPAAALLRDWDGDLAADVLARNEAGELWLYPGNGSGAFGVPRRVGTGWQPFDVVVRAGDLDGDGDDDVVARRRDSAELWLYSGDGLGSFRQSRRIGTGWGAMVQILAPGDWDGDGTPDLLAVHRDGRMLSYATDGTGRVVGSRVVGSGWQPGFVAAAVGDFDGDRRPDLLARVAATGQLRLYPGDGTGGFRSWRQAGTGWNGLDPFVGAGDWDGDGRADVLGRAAGGQLYLYSGNGGGGVASGRQVGSGWGGWSLVQ